MININDSVESAIIQIINENIESFNKNDKHLRLTISLYKIKKSFERCAKLVEEIRQFAPEYDFDDKTPFNGYRSFVEIFESAIKEIVNILQQITIKKEKFLFSSKKHAK